MRNYERSTAIIVSRFMEEKGYFCIADVRDECHANFLVGLYRYCRELVTSGKLVYDLHTRQYKKP